VEEGLQAVVWIRASPQHHFLNLLKNKLFNEIKSGAGVGLSLQLLAQLLELNILILTTLIS